jgi:hypothetical protein
MPGNMMASQGGLYCRQGDVLLMALTPAIALTGTYYVYYRMQQSSDGQVVDNFTAFSGVALAAVAPNYFQVPLPEGWLLAASICNLTVAQLAGASGAVLAQLFLSPGNIAQQPVVPQPFMQAAVCLIAQCIPAEQTASWVSSGTPSARFGTDGAPFNQSFAVSNPAAGANFSYTALLSYRYEIINIRLQLVTAVAAGSRQVGIKFTDTLGNVFCSVFAQGTQTLSQTNQYNFAAGVGASIGTAATLIAIPTADDIQVPLPAGLQINDATVISSVVNNIQAADQISAVVIRAKTWNEQD